MIINKILKKKISQNNPRIKNINLDFSIIRVIVAGCSMSNKYIQSYVWNWFYPYSSNSLIKDYTFKGEI